MPVRSVQPEPGMYFSGYWAPPMPTEISTSPVGSATLVGYQRPRFMFSSIVQVFVRKSNTLVHGLLAWFRPPVTNTDPSSIMTSEAQNMSCAGCGSSTKSPVAGFHTAA